MISKALIQNVESKK